MTVIRAPRGVSPNTSDNDMSEDMMSEDMDGNFNGRAGFDRPAPREENAKQRSTLTLIATAALAISTVVAATAVSIGIARADVAGVVADSSHGPFAAALILGIVLAGWSRFAATIRREKK
jgi:hypothetical protein